MADTTTKDIVISWLKLFGYDGLFDPGNCACSTDDIAPCGELSLYCQPGYKQPCNGTCDSGNCDFHISSEKKE